MLVERPKVRQIVEAAVAEIKAAGVEPTVADILWLAHLAEFRCQPNKSDPLDDFDIPVRCGLAKLHRMTMAGEVWLRECAAAWWPRPAHGYMALLADIYALAHGRDEKAMTNPALWGRKTARAVVVGWAVAHLAVTPSVIARALYLVSGGTDWVRVKDHTGKIVKKQAEEVSPYDYGEDLAALCAVYKREPRYFLFEVSAKQAQRMMRKAALALGRPDLSAESEGDADTTFAAWRLVVNEIIAKGKKAAESNG